MSEFTHQSSSCFTEYYVLTCLWSHLALSSPSCHMGFPFPCISLRFHSLQNSVLISGDVCHVFPTHKTFLSIITTNVVTLNIIKAFLFFVSIYWWYLFHDLGLWLCNRQAEPPLAFDHEDGGSLFHWNVRLPLNYTLLQPKLLFMSITLLFVELHRGWMMF